MDKIYDRQPTDTDKSWSAFCKYRDMGGDRSLEKVRQEIGHRSGRNVQILRTTLREAFANLQTHF